MATKRAFMSLILFQILSFFIIINLMGYFKPFIGGMAIGNLIFMNHVYENELLKQQIRDEISTLKRMRDFVSEW
jgi:hypothetical protein